jgi:diguanylate cyclase (GGDEF)-like protein
MIKLSTSIIYHKVNELSIIKYQSITHDQTEKIVHWILRRSMFLDDMETLIQTKKNLDMKQLEEVLASFVRENHDSPVYDLYYISSSNEVASTYLYNHNIPKADIDYRNEDVYKNALTSEEVVFTSVHKSVYNNKLAISLSKQVISGTKTIGVIGIDILVDTIASIFHEFDVGDAYCFLLDNKYRLIVHPNEAFYYKEEPKAITDLNEEGYKLIRDAIVDNQRFITVEDYDGYDRTFYFTKIGDSKWLVITAVDNSFITKENRILTRHLYSVSLTTMIICVILEICLRLISTYRMAKEYRRVRELALRDQLTNSFNRTSYENDLKMLESQPIDNNLVVIAFDLNGLKSVNDNMGHAAGDEFLRGASHILESVFSPYGKVYRTGGDEYIALIFIDESKLHDLFAQFEVVMDTWKGENVQKMSISYGYALRNVNQTATLERLASIADDAMYAAKAKYYQSTGIDRRRR